MFKFTGVISFEGSYGELHRRDTKLMFFSNDSVLTIDFIIRELLSVLEIMSTQICKLGGVANNLSPREPGSIDSAH